MQKNETIEFSDVTHPILRCLEEWEHELSNLKEETITIKRNHQNRSIRQIIGHLIDSAANNHQRIVRLQYNKVLVFPDYQQDNDLWISLQDYQQADWRNMVLLWKYYNLHLVQVIRSVDPECLGNTWSNFEGKSVTLQQMIEGYTGHLALHMAEIRELLG